MNHMMLHKLMKLNLFPKNIYSYTRLVSIQLLYRKEALHKHKHIAEMPLVGDYPTYDAFCDENWLEFTQKLDVYLSLNDITDGQRKTAVLISCVCEQTYDILRNLCYPIKPKDKQYDQLIALLNRIYNKSDERNGGVFRQRYQFYHAKQLEDETILGWLERIKVLADGCQFGDRYSVIVADRFLSGLKSSAVIGRISQQYGVLKLWQLVELALRYETEIEGDSVSESLVKLNV